MKKNASKQKATSIDEIFLPPNETTFRDVTLPADRQPCESPIANLVLSVFPGIDLLGRGFEAEGYHVFRGPDLIWGGDIRHFFPPRLVFEGFIGGSPCQDFSKARRSTPSGYGLKMLAEFVRVVGEGLPDWFLLENVPGVPDVFVEGYSVQRFFLNARECGCLQRRHRRFQFGFRSGFPLVIPPPIVSPAPSVPTCLATEANKPDRRSFADFCELQGLPRSFDLPGLSLAAKYRCVGNGVPIPMARVLAAAVRRRFVTFETRTCVCGCGRACDGKALHYSAACRKRMQRSRCVPAADKPAWSVTA